MFLQFDWICGGCRVKQRLHQHPLTQVDVGFAATMRTGKRTLRSVAHCWIKSGDRVGDRFCRKGKKFAPISALGDFLAAILLICVVEQPKDVIALEKTGACKWVYHVLGGHIAPLEGVDAGDLTIDKLIERVRSGDVKEVIMATNPNLTGDGTSLYISSLLRRTGVKITRLARGLATGSTIEYASGKMLADAIIGRQTLE